MKSITPALSSFHSPTDLKHNTIDSNLYKFICMNYSLQKIKFHSDEKKLTTWIKKKENKFNTNKGADYIKKCYSKLNIDLNTESVLTTARIYANVLQKYNPNHAGELHLFFNYYQLVFVINFVFKKHICNDIALSSKGIVIDVDKLKFFAKLEKEKMFIVISGKRLGTGGYGIVKLAYEIFSHQYFALKSAVKKGKEALAKEISQLNKMHAYANQEKKSTWGLQSPPLATFNIDHCMNGYLTIKHGQNLFGWIETNPLSSDRITVCKNMVQAYKNKEDLGIWHGDIKPDNILLFSSLKKDIVIIDWAGAIQYDEAAINFTKPKPKTAIYLNDWDLQELRTAKEESNKENFLKSARNIELFSLSMTLFYVLSGQFPFYLMKNLKTNKLYTDFQKGIPTTAMSALERMNYSNKLLTTIKTMLNNEPSQRYSCDQVFAFWQSIT